MSTIRHLAGTLIDGEHIYVHRAEDGTPVWLGRRAHIAALDPEQVLWLVQYRLAFDARCCARVN